MEEAIPKGLVWTLCAVAIVLCGSFVPGDGANLRFQVTTPEAPLAKRIRVNGADLAYVEQGRGEPVVLIHGFLHDYRVWCAQVTELSKHYRVIAYSKRYRWPNTLSGDASDVSDSVDEADLVALIRQLKLGRVHLVGHSAGVGLALRVARDHSELVRTLVLGEPGPGAMAVNTVEVTSPFTPGLISEIRQSYERGDREDALHLVADAVTGEKERGNASLRAHVPSVWTISGN